MAEKKLLKRETYCGAVREEHVGQTITVYGWVNNMRELGGLTFIDLRDREGLLQIVVNETFTKPEILKKHRQGNGPSRKRTGGLARQGQPRPAKRKSRTHRRQHGDPGRFGHPAFRPGKPQQRLGGTAPQIPLPRPAQPGHAAKFQAALQGKPFDPKFPGQRRIPGH